jgi:phosphodiesterase/alkaline phosphatase D-like protein
MISRRRFLAAVPGAVVAASLPLGARGRGSILGIWIGAVTPRSATIKALTAAPHVPMSVSWSDGATARASQTVVADGNGVATFVLMGLASRTRYRYVVSAPGEPGLEGSFRTFADGPFSFRLIFASCASTGSNSSVFAAMREMQPDLFVHMGDLHYENISRNDVQLFRRAYARVLASPNQSALFRAVPLAYTWDDHDYGANNSDRTSPSRPAALQAYRTFIPHYPLDGGADAPVHQGFTIGRVRVLMTDARSARSPGRMPEAERTMFGPLQLAWLERELEAARAAPLVVLVNTVPWITKRKETTGDGWARYARERRHLADLIVRHDLTRRLVMLSGDAHMLAMDDGTNSQYSALANAPARGFIVAHAAPMDQRPTKKGGPYSHPEVAQNGQFGVMDVTDEAGALTVKLWGMRGPSPVAGMEMTLRSVPPPAPSS